MRGGKRGDLCNDERRQAALGPNALDRSRRWAHSETQRDKGEEEGERRDEEHRESGRGRRAMGARPCIGQLLQLPRSHRPSQLRNANPTINL